MNPPQPRANLDALLAILQRALGHEVPNHLIAVQGMARLLELEESERLGPDGRDYLQRLSAAAQRAHGQVRALADFIRALRSQAPAAPVSLPDVVREAATEVNQLFSGCSIEYHFPEHGPYLRMPGTALRQVVVSLLRNARGAALPEQILRVEIGARETPTAVELWVADNGRGLSPEQQQKLLDPSHFLDVHGEGLGLVLARQLAETWAGRLVVESSEKHGSRFSIIWPGPAGEARNKL